MQQFEGEYLGGNMNLKVTGGFRKTNVLIRVEPDRLAVYFAVAPLSHQYKPQPAWAIQYRDITRIECLPSERISALRMYLLPAAAVALQKKELYFNITYKDEIGMEQNIAFKVKQAEDCYRMVYEKIAETRKK